MDPILVTRDDLELIKRLQIKARPDCLASFGANCRGEVWPWVNWGFTPDPKRKQVRGLSRVIDEIVKRYLTIRGEGGRFFIDATGAFYSDETGRWKHQFVNFRHCI
jgi:hypothetical protein